MLLSPPLTRCYAVRWMSVSAEHLVVLIIVVALVVKYVLFEAPDAEQIQLKVQAEDQAMREYWERYVGDTVPPEAYSDLCAARCLEYTLFVFGELSSTDSIQCLAVF